MLTYLIQLWKARSQKPETKVDFISIDTIIALTCKSAKDRIHLSHCVFCTGYLTSDPHGELV